MGNLVTTIKRFISNKNTVTILAIIAGVIVLWYFYNYRVNEAISTIKVPYAINAIDAGKKIESDNISTKEITRNAVKNSEIITNQSELDNKYICIGTSIPKDGFFYRTQLCEKEALPNSVLDNIPDGYTLYNLKVNNEMTYANSILPGDYIDLYLSAKDDDGQIIYGKLIESIEVAKVTDSSGKDVFWDTTAGDSAFLLFTVPDEYAKLLEVSELISSNSIKITPVPRSASYTQNPGETLIASQTLYTFIMNKSASYVD